jgi:hypothetical protein
VLEEGLGPLTSWSTFSLSSGVIVGGGCAHSRGSTTPSLVNVANYVSTGLPLTPSLIHSRTRSRTCSWTTDTHSALLLPSSRLCLLLWEQASTCPVLHTHTHTTTHGLRMVRRFHPILCESDDEQVAGRIIVTKEGWVCGWVGAPISHPHAPTNAHHHDVAPRDARYCSGSDGCVVRVSSYNGEALTALMNSSAH